MSHAIRIPDDCEFPQLHALANKKRLAAALQQQLDASCTHRIARCRLLRLHYKPGICRVQIKAKISDGAGRELGEQIYCGRIFPAGEGRSAFAAARHTDLLQPAFGRSLSFIPEWEMVLWAYPNDPDLPALSTLLQPDKLRALIAAAPQALGLEQHDQPVTATATVIKHVPGQRCMFLVDLTCAQHGTHRVFGKAYTEGAGRAAFNLMQAIWQTSACQRGEFRLPRPYSYDAQLDLVWQEAIAGQALSELEDKAELPRLGRRAGEALAAFHGSGVQLPEQMNLAYQMQELQRAQAAVHESFPQYAATFSAIYDRLLAAQAQLPPVRLTPVHATFKFSHILHDGRNLVFIDFDGANQGDPCYDLGRFAAYLGKMQAQGEITADLAQRTFANFRAAYLQNATQAIANERIAWFASSQLLSSQVYKAMKSSEGTLVEQLLHLAANDWTDYAG